MRTVTLTEQQANFVIHFTTTPDCIGNGAASARAAGYSEHTAKEIGRQLLAKPHVRNAVDEALRRQVSGPAAAKATAFLEGLIGDESKSDKLRLEAAKTILDRAGIVAPSHRMGAFPDGGADQPKTLAEAERDEAAAGAALAFVRDMIARLSAGNTVLTERRVVEVSERVVELHAEPAPLVVDAERVAAGRGDL